MRVLMLDNEFPPLGGGTGVVNEHLLRGFARQADLTVDLVTSSRTADTFEVEQFAERITLYKVPVDNKNIHHSTNRELLRYVRRGLAACERLIRQHRYDVGFAFAGVPAGAMSWLMNLRHRIPYVVSLQGPDVPGFEARYNTLYPVLTPLLKQVWRRAAAVTAISAEHRALAHKTMPGLNIPVIYNGVDTQTFHPPAAAPAGPLTFICVGRLIERKGQHHLLRAFAQLRAAIDRPTRLVLVGTGDFEPALRALAGELKLGDSVEFAGFKSREEMPAVYREAHVFVLASQSEGMSIALLEAMAAGLPVVVSDAGGTAELVDARNGRVVPWADIPALAKALAAMSADGAPLAQMGLHSRAIAERFGWPAIVQAYADLCRRIARSDGATAGVSMPDLNNASDENIAAA